MAEGGQRSTPRLAAGSKVTIAVAIMNVTTYAFTLLAARWLAPSEFGAVGALMGLLLVLNVAGLALQTTAARRVATADVEQRAAIARQMMALTYAVSVALGLLTLAAAPVTNAVLDLDSLPTAALLAITASLQSLTFGQAGVIQGERRWVPLAWLYALNGGGRFVCGAVMMLVRPDAFGAMLGVAAGALAPVVAGTLALRSDGILRPTAWREARHVLVELTRNARALLAFLGVSNADILVARSVLPSHDSGLYAGGLILTKAVLFLPQFLIVLGFPTMAAGGAARTRGHRRALGVLVVLGLAAAAASALVPALALEFVGGSEYGEIERRLWLFAALGLALSLVQFLVYDAVARQDHAALASVWIALVLLASSATWVGSVEVLLGWAIAVNGVLVVVLLALSLVPTRSREPADQPVAP